MRIFRTFFCILFLQFCLVLSSSAQQDTLPYNSNIVINTINGVSFEGFLIDQDSSSIKLRNESIGEIRVLRSNIKSLKVIQPEELKKGEYWFVNPNATRHLFGPTGYGLKKGEGYYQNVWVVLNSVSYGFTDYFTIGAGLEFITLFQGHPIFYVTPKFSIPINDKNHAGAGLLYMGAPWEELDNFSIGIAYGVYTFGGRENNITLGGGYGFTNGTLADHPIITLSGMVRTGKHFGLVTENWAIPIEGDYEIIFGIGLRYMRRDFTIDLALITHNEMLSNQILGVPFLDIVIPFGNKP